MRFTDEMDEDVAWLNEYAYMRLGNIVYMQAYYYGARCSYAGDIYYLAYQEEHDLVRDFLNESQHSIVCIACNTSFGFEAHTLYRPLGANYRVCSGCYAKFFDNGMILDPLEEDDRVIM